MIDYNINEEESENEEVIDIEHINIVDGDENSFYIANDGNIFGIAYDKLIRPELTTAYNNYVMKSKRNFKNISNLVLETYEELFLDDKDELREDMEYVLYKILNVTYKMLNNDRLDESTRYDIFIEMFDDIINDNDRYLVKVISDYVENNYKLTLDQDTEDSKEKKKKVNEELQFTDEHAKALLKIAYLSRLMVPLISTFFYYNKDNFARSEYDANKKADYVEDLEEYKFDEANSRIFEHVFNVFTDDPDALRNKIYKLISSRIAKTSYSDKKFWETAKPLGITKQTEALDIYKKVLTHAIPKLSLSDGKNVVNFLHAVVKNQIDFLFQVKFKYKFTVLSEENNKLGDTDDDAPTDYERIENQMLREDEGKLIIRRAVLEQVLDNLPTKLGVEVSDDEVRELTTSIHRHTIQERIVALLTDKYFNDPDIIKLANIYQYTKLVLICKRYLEANKFIYLPKMMIARCEKHKERLNISGKKIRPLIMVSKKYKELFETKYKFFDNKISSTLLSMISTTYSSVYKDEYDNDVVDTSIKVGKIAEEFIDLGFLI